MNTSAVRQQLCAAFCADLSVREVPAGIAVSAMFDGLDGDPIRCFVRSSNGGWRMEDDGRFLADLDASGVSVLDGDRRRFLDLTLSTARGHVDTETLQMVAEGSGPEPDPRTIVSFLSALTRARDVAFWTKERVRSTFKTDAVLAIRAALGENGVVDETGLIAGFEDYKSDLVIRPKGPGKGRFVTAVFFAQAVEPLTEALLLRTTLSLRGRNDLRVAALLQDGTATLTNRKVVRAINKLDGFGVFGPDEPDAVHRIIRTALADFEPGPAHH